MNWLPLAPPVSEENCSRRAATLQPVLSASGIILLLVFACGSAAGAIEPSTTTPPETAQSLTPPAEADGGFTGVDRTESSAMVVVRESGLTPSTLVPLPLRGSLFIMNGTAESLLGVEVYYGSHRAFAVGGHFTMTNTGVFQTKTALAPRRFVVTTFIEPGIYPVRVFGTDGKEWMTTIAVNEGPR